MTTARSQPADVVHGDELCIRDPGGENRSEIENTEPDHAPPADPDGLDRMLAPMEEALLAAVSLSEGEVVTDVGCGSGATTFAAARAVGRGGAAHGVDITPAMLDIARARQELLGIQNVSFTEADAQTATLPCGADAAMSRFGTMFFDEPITAFENVRRSLQPRGRLGIVTWQPLEQNAWLVVPGAALLPWIALPDLNGKGPGMFSQSDAVTIVQTLAQAGFTDIDSRPLKLALPLGRNVDQAYALLADTGVGRGALSAVPEPQRDAAADAVRSALEPHAHADGVWLGAAILLTTARTSS